MTDSSSEPTGNTPFASVNLDNGNGDDINLVSLHAQVLSRNGRVELMRNGQSCVLISKRELESLEEALEILSNTEAMRAIRAEIAEVARLATPRAPIVPGYAPPSRIRSFNLP